MISGGLNGGSSSFMVNLETLCSLILSVATLMELDKLLKYFGINISEIFNPERYKSEHGNGSGGDVGGNGSGDTGNGPGGSGDGGSGNESGGSGNGGSGTGNME